MRILGFAAKLLFCVVLIVSFNISSVNAATGRDVGVATGTSLLWTNEKRLDQRLRDIKALGATWVRIEFNWAEIQPESYYEYKWGAYDRVIQAMKRHDLRVVATLAYTPKWARNWNCIQRITDEIAGQKCSPRNTVEFGSFVRAAVIRYKNYGIYTWEIWNEPNLTGYWKTVRPGQAVHVDPAAYARTANAAAQEIHNHDPGAFIITGGLAPMFEPNRRGMRQSDFLAEALPKLNRNLFDAVGIHPYSWPKLPSTEANYNAFYTVDGGDSEYNIRRAMINAGWGDKQIWATEFGASTHGKRVMDSSAPIMPGHRPDHVSEEHQAAIIGEGLNIWHRKSNVGPLFIHSDSDEWLTRYGNERGYGLRREDGSKKPAYYEFQREVQLLR